MPDIVEVVVPAPDQQIVQAFESDPGTGALIPLGMPANVREVFQFRTQEACPTGNALRDCNIFTTRVGNKPMFEPDTRNFIEQSKLKRFFMQRLWG